MLRRGAHLRTTQLSAMLSVLNLLACADLLGLDEDRRPLPEGYAERVRADGALLHYPMEETDGVLHSAVPGAPAGNPQGTVIHARPGAVGSGLELDGQSGHVVVGDHFGFSGTAPMTLEVWTSIDLVAGFRQIVHKGSGSAGQAQGYTLSVDDSENVEFSRVVDGDYRPVRFKLQPSDYGRYLHIVATFDGVRSRLYLDGQLVDENPNAGIELKGTTAPLTLGRFSEGSAGFFAGRLDELAIYGEALKAPDIQQHFQLATGQ